MANHIYLAGDSTVQTYGDSTNQGGWGQFLGSHLPEHIQVINRAIGKKLENICGRGQASGDS